MVKQQLQLIFLNHKIIINLLLNMDDIVLAIFMSDFSKMLFISIGVTDL